MSRRGQRPGNADPDKLPFPKPADSTEYNMGFRDLQGSHHLSPFCVGEGDGDWDILLRSSAEYGNDEKVREALQGGANVNARNEWTGMTAMHLACLSGKDKCVKELLYYRPNVNLKCQSGNTPYMLAAYRGHEECMQLLKAYTKNGETLLKPEERNVMHNNARELAWKNNHIECARLA